MLDRLSDRSSHRFSALQLPFRNPSALALAALALLGTGCQSNFVTTSTGRNPSSIQAATMHGKIFGGQQPIGGATVNLYAAGTTGYGTGSTLLATTTTSTDGYGTFTLNLVTAPDGNANDYVCPSANAPVYLVSVGGNTQVSGTSTNGAAVLMAALGRCDLSGALSVVVNEVSTVASVSALAQYINPGSTTPGTVALGSPGDYTLATLPQSATGLINAFANVPLLENVATGLAVSSTTLTGTATAVSGATVTATAETAKINHIANILASCVNQATSAGGNCASLFGAAVPPPNAAFTSQPTATFAAAVDTLQAAYYMATNPTDVAAITANGANTSTANLATLYALPPAASPFQPALSARPTDWTLGIVFNGGTSVCSGTTNPFINYPYSISIDAGGNLWMANGGSASVGATTQMSPNGMPLNCSGTIFGSRGGAVIDTAGNVWSTSNITSAVYKFNGTTTTTITAAGKTYGIGPDGAGNIFYTVPASAALYSLPSTATASTTPTSIGAVASGSAYGLAVDTKGTVIVGQSGGGGTTIATTAPTKVGGATYATPASLTAANNFAGVYGLAVDASGNFWISNSAGGSSGSATASGTPPGNTASYITPAFSSTTAGATNTVTFSESTADGLFTGGLSTPRQIAIDGAGNVWTANNTSASSGAYGVTELSKTNLALSPTQTATAVNAGGFTTYTQNGGFQKASTFFTGLRGLAIDPSGNVWTSNTGSTGNTTVTMMVGAAVPVVTPIAQQLKSGSGPIKP